MIDLADHAVHTVLESCDRKNWASTPLAGSGPRIPGQQAEHCWTRGLPASRNVGFGGRDFIWTGHTVLTTEPACLPLAFVVHIKEGAILHNWPTQRSTELIVVKACFWVGVPIRV